MKRVARALLIVMILMMSMVACGKESSDKDVDASAQATKKDDTAVQDNETVPTEAVKQESEQVEAEEAPSQDKDWSEYRVVASSVAVVEILDALGVPMVGVPTSSYELPASVAEAARIGNPMSPDMEVIKSLEPTVVISVSTLSEDLKTQFQALEIPCEFLDLSSYDGLKTSIESVGTYFDLEEKAEELVNGFEAKEAAIAEKIADQESPSVLIMFGAADSFMVATEKTYVGDLVQRVNASNVISGANGSFIPVDMEYLADKNPEYILLLTHANPEESLKALNKEFETNEAWQNFDAVINEKVIALDTGYFGMSANLLATDAMDKLVDYLYAE